MTTDNPEYSAAVERAADALEQRIETLEKTLRINEWRGTPGWIRERTEDLDNDKKALVLIRPAAPEDPAQTKLDLG